MIQQRLVPPALYGAPIPDDSDGRYQIDSLRISGDYSPGFLTITRASIPYSWDKRKGYGYTGAWLIYTGKDLAEIECTFKIVSEDQRVAFALWMKKYLTVQPAQPQQNSAFLPNIPKPKALTVFNPLLAEIGITSIVPKSIGQWVPGTGAALGSFTRKIDFYQYQAPQPAIGKPNQPIPDTKKTPPTAESAQELENRAKRLQIERNAQIKAKLLGESQ